MQHDYLSDIPEASLTELRQAEHLDMNAYAKGELRKRQAEEKSKDVENDMDESEEKPAMIPNPKTIFVLLNAPPFWPSFSNPAPCEGFPQTALVPPPNRFVEH